MSVATELGLAAGLESASLVAASGCWRRWSGADKSLVGPEGVADLRSWLRAARPIEADRVLHALVRLGSPTAGDEPLAVDVVGWALLPGARVLARRLHGLSPQVDRLVATQLWLEVRTFPWERLSKVAANVLANTRARVLAGELLASSDARRGVKAGCRPVDPHSPWWEQHAALRGPADLGGAVGLGGEAELGGVLAAASACGALPADDRLLLTVVLEQAHLGGGGGARRGRGGLLADRVVDGVVVATGLSPATVRRRVRRAVIAIAAAQRAGLIEAA